MHKREFFLPVIILGLSVVFAAVALGVYLTRGKSSFWLSKKMLIGSLLISFTSITNQSCESFITSCYDPVMPNGIQIDGSGSAAGIDVNLKENNMLKGTLYDRSGEYFSFKVTDSTHTIVYQSGIINAVDGAFDQNIERISIELDTTLASDTYRLKLFTGKLDSLNYQLSHHKLNIYND